MSNELDEDIQKLIGKPSGWILRWGMSTLLLLLIAFLIFAALFRYPDRLAADVRLLAGNVPAEIVARNDGRLEAIYAKDGELVEAEDWLAIIENTADADRVQSLKVGMNSWVFSESGIQQINLDGIYSLGELQSAFARFEQQLSMLKSWLAADRTHAREQLLGSQMEELVTVSSALGEQEVLLRRELEIASTTLIRQRTLFGNGGISRAELDWLEREQLQSERALQEILIRQNENERFRQSLDQSRLEVGEMRGKFIANELPVLRQYAQDLSMAIETWEQAYVLKTPVAGLLSSSRFNDVRQQVKSGDLVFTILANTEEKGWHSEARISSKGAGLINLGDVVEVELFDFPEPQFGLLLGNVSSISLTPEAGIYLMQIAVSDTLKTTYNKILPRRPILEGQAKIITDKRSLLRRIIDDIRAIGN